jgi:hypothetical protein
MTNCGVKEFVGISEKNFPLKVFKQELMHKFGPDSCLGSFGGAIFFSGAYDMMDSHGPQVSNKPERMKHLVLERVEIIKTFLIEEGLGTVVDMPEFVNHNHKTKIVPFMLYIDPVGMRKAMQSWKNAGLKPVNSETNNVWQL